MLSGYQEERILARITESQRQVRSELNRYYARQRLNGQEPTLDDLAEQWEKHGGRAAFEKQFPAVA